MSELTKDKLLQARGLIELGWTQGTPYDPCTNDTECYCLGGAIAKVLFNDPYKMYDLDTQYVFKEFAELADLPIRNYGAEANGRWDYDLGDPDWTSSVYYFNDENSKEDVLAAIDKAVSKLDQGSDQ